MKKKYVVAVQFYFEDGWYGTRRRYIYAGENGEGFDSKGEARTHTSMLKKYLKKVSGIKETGKVEIDELEKLETYRYCGAGPSWSCNNCMVDALRFSTFVERENEEMGERRRVREFNEKHRQTRKERSESMRKGRENRMARK